jgi:hypothetical protein
MADALRATLVDMGGIVYVGKTIIPSDVFHEIPLCRSRQFFSASHRLDADMRRLIAVAGSS